jgi:cytochrome c553
MKLLPLLGIVPALWAASACDRVSIVDRTPSTEGLGGSGGSGGVGGTGGGSGSGGAAAQGLPCAVEAVLVTHCGSCHGNPPTGGAPRALVTYDDLTRAALTNSSLTEAEAALRRMQSTTAPMPPAPAPRPSSQEIAALESWIDGGYPSEACGTGGGGSGGSSGGGGPNSNP